MEIIYLNEHPDMNKSFIDLLNESISTEESKKVLSGICHIQGRNGSPDYPYAIALNGVNSELCEFRFTLENNILLRINYFIDKIKNVIVILNRYFKPDGIKNRNAYNKQSAKTISKETKTHINIALNLKKDYYCNKGNYETLC